MAAPVSDQVVPAEPRPRGAGRERGPPVGGEGLGEERGPRAHWGLALGAPRLPRLPSGSYESQARCS